MNHVARDPVLASRRVCRLLLLACAAIAIAAVPIESMTWQWLTALLAPAALIAALSVTESWPFRRALALTLLQLSSCLLALQTAGPLPRPVALAAMLLPPLAFVVVRRHETDRSLGLFLSLCVLLVGTILQPAEPALVLAYVLVATAQLRCDSRLRALELCAAPTPNAHAPRPSIWLLSSLLGVLSAAVAFAVDAALDRLPALESLRAAPAQQPATSKKRSTGLSDQFELGGDGVLSNLRGEHLLTARSTDSSAISPRLYLRSGFFQAPGLDTWQVGTLQPDQRDSSATACRLHQAVAGVPTRVMLISRTQSARNLVFVPPATHTLLGIPDLLCDPATEWFRQLRDGHLDDYEVHFQDLALDSRDARIDEAWARRGLLALPQDLDRRRFEPLLAGIHVGDDPLQKAAAIGAMLQERCRYERREPGGPYQSALLNFLYGERIGFCMHFASAAAILLRMSSVPCRIGVGLYGGVESDRGERRYGSQHAHAWVEIPIVGRGFLVFDPTPPALRGALPEQPALASSAGDTAPATTDAGSDSAFWRALEGAWPFVLILTVLTLPFVRRRRRAHVASPTVARAVWPARRLLLTLLQTLAERGYPRSGGATLEQFAHELAREGAIAADLQAALVAYQEVRFGGRVFTRDHALRLQKGIAAAEVLQQRQVAN